MRVEQTPIWRTYKRHLRNIINISISQALGSLDREEKMETRERLKKATDRLDSMFYTNMKLAQLVREERRGKHVDGTKRQADGKESGSGAGEKEG
jgi:hypothetical protein